MCISGRRRNTRILNVTGVQACAIHITVDMGITVSGIGAKSYVYLIPNYYFREFFAVIKELISKSK